MALIRGYGLFGCSAVARRHVLSTALLKRWGLPVHRAHSVASGTEAVPFERTAGDARADFTAWWMRTTPTLSPPAITSVTSIFLPHWVFIADIAIPSISVRRVAHTGPPLQIYSGTAYPRPMLTVLKNDITLSQPFSSRMLDLRDGGRVEVEPFALFEATAWGLARQQQLQHELDVNSIGTETSSRVLSDARFSNVESHRVLQPAHIVRYHYLSVEFLAFVNGHSGDG